MPRQAKRYTILTYDPKTYELEALKAGSLTYKQQLKEYARLRNIANRRLEAFERNPEPHIRKSEAYKQNVGRYTLPATQLTQRQLRGALADISKFVSSKSGSVTGQRRLMNQKIEALHRSGYDFVNKQNYWEFVDFMEQAQSAYAGMNIPDSDTVIDLFDIVKNKAKIKVSPKKLGRDVRKFVKNAKKIRDIGSKIDEGSLSSEQAKALINSILK